LGLFVCTTADFRTAVAVTKPIQLNTPGLYLCYLEMLWTPIQTDSPSSAQTGHGQQMISQPTMLQVLNSALF
jgi:hypothetical protein